MRDKSHGQALTEFALVVPLLLLLFMGVVDFGRAIFSYNEVSNAAREAARTGIIDQNASDIASRAAQQGTVLGLPTSPSSAANCPSPDGPTSEPSGTCVNFRSYDLSADCSSSISVGCVVDVSVKYTFRPITPIISNIVGPIVLTSTSKEVIEYVCPTSTQPTCSTR